MINDIKVAFAFLTRIPIGHKPDISIQRSAVWFPFVGWVIGGVTGILWQRPGTGDANHAQNPSGWTGRVWCLFQGHCSHQGGPGDASSPAGGTSVTSCQRAY